MDFINRATQDARSGNNNSQNREDNYDNQRSDGNRRDYDNYNSNDNQGYSGNNQSQNQGYGGNNNQQGYSGSNNNQSYGGNNSHGDSNKQSSGGLLGSLAAMAGGNKQQGQGQGEYSQGQGQNQQGQSSGGFLGGLTNKFNEAAGGGRESEKNEDYLDKGVDYVQEKFLGQGPQDNESAVEQAKDEQISDFIRKQYKGVTGSDIPIKDKETRFG